MQVVMLLSSSTQAVLHYVVLVAVGLFVIMTLIIPGQETIATEPELK